MPINYGSGAGSIYDTGAAARAIAAQNIAALNRTTEAQIDASRRAFGALTGQIERFGERRDLMAKEQRARDYETAQLLQQQQFELGPRAESQRQTQYESAIARQVMDKKSELEKAFSEASQLRQMTQRNRTNYERFRATEQEIEQSDMRPFQKLEFHNRNLETLRFAIPNGDPIRTPQEMRDQSSFFDEKTGVRTHYKPDGSIDHIENPPGKDVKQEAIDKRRAEENKALLEIGRDVYKETGDPSVLLKAAKGIGTDDDGVYQPRFGEFLDTLGSLSGQGVKKKMPETLQSSILKEALNPKNFGDTEPTFEQSSEYIEKANRLYGINQGVKPEEQPEPLVTREEYEKASKEWKEHFDTYERRKLKGSWEWGGLRAIPKASDSKQRKFEKNAEIIRRYEEQHAQPATPAETVSPELNALIESEQRQMAPVVTPEVPAPVAAPMAHRGVVPMAPRGTILSRSQAAAKEIEKAPFAWTVVPEVRQKVASFTRMASALTSDPLVRDAIQRDPKNAEAVKELRQLLIDNADSLSETGEQLPVSKLKRIKELREKIMEEGASGGRTGEGGMRSPRRTSSGITPTGGLLLNPRSGA